MQHFTFTAGLWAAPQPSNWQWLIKWLGSDVSGWVSPEFGFAEEAAVPSKVTWWSCECRTDWQRDSPQLAHWWNNKMLLTVYAVRQTAETRSRISVACHSGCFVFWMKDNAVVCQCSQCPTFYSVHPVPWMTPAVNGSVCWGFSNSVKVLCLLYLQEIKPFVCVDVNSYAFSKEKRTFTVPWVPLLKTLHKMMWSAKLLAFSSLSFTYPKAAQKFGNFHLFYFIYLKKKPSASTGTIKWWVFTWDFLGKVWRGKKSCLRSNQPRFHSNMVSKI